MSPLDEETIEASLARINAGLQSINAALQSTGSPEVFEQYKQGVYLNKPFGRSEHAHEVARALGEGQGYARVERDKDPNQNDQYWVRLLKPNEITNDMLPNATGVMDEMRRLEHDVPQKPEPAEPQSEDIPAPTPTGKVVSTASFKVVEPAPTLTGEVVSTASFKVVELREKSAHLPGYAYAGGQQLNTIFEVGDGGGAKAVAIKGIRSQRDAMLELHSDGHVAIHVDAADALGGIRDYTRYLTTRDDRDLSQPGGPLVVEFTKEELANVASISTVDAGQFGRRTVITSNDNRSLNVMAGDVQIALKTGDGEITIPVSASGETLSTLRAKHAE
jgi:hypothetical protein